MSRVVALIGDLLFGSKVQAMLDAAGHDVDLVSAAADAAGRVAQSDVLVVDLTTEDPGGEAVGRLVRAAREVGHVRILGVYSHVEADTKRRAEAAGFDLVVPKSRMAREGAELVARLSAPAA